MNTKEVSELRRRWQAEKNAVKRIYGCYVNASGEIVTDLDEPLSLMPQEEAEQYFALLKKALSGKLGKNLLDLVFSTQQVADSDEHRLLMSLRDSELQDLEARQAFYQKAVESLHLEGSYLLLLAHDTYDVPTKAKDGAALEDGENVFSYLLCAVCPVKEGKPGLGYYAGDNEFHCFAPQTVAAPECGFLFPAFDARRPAPGIHRKRVPHRCAHGSGAAEGDLPGVLGGSPGAVLQHGRGPGGVQPAGWDAHGAQGVRQGRASHRHCQGFGPHPPGL